MKLTINERQYEAHTSGDTVVVDGQPFRIRRGPEGEPRTIIVNDHPYRVEVPPDQLPLRTVLVDGKAYNVTLASGAPAGVASRQGSPGHRATPVLEGALLAPLTGQVIAIFVQPGAQVSEDATILIIEALKMENEIKAPRAGRVKEVLVSLGSRVNEGDPLMILE